MEAEDSEITVFSNMCPVAGVYFQAWQHVSDSCSERKLSEHSSPTPFVVYLHVETRPLRRKTILRHRGRRELVGFDLMRLHPQRRTLCHAHTKHTTDTIRWYVTCICIVYKMYSSFEQTSTYSLAPWRHVVCFWLVPLPPSASALSLADVRKTVLLPDKLSCHGWIVSVCLCPEMI